MKKHQLVAYAFLPILAMGTLGVTSLASAQGFGGMWSASATPDDIAARQQTMFQTEAQILGISIDDVKAAWAEGKTPMQIAEEKGISKDQIQARMKEIQTQKIKTQLQALVDKGVITQAQADKRLQVVQTQVESKTQKGGRGHHGMMMGGFGI
jgi:hypothetical protein